MGVSSVGMSAIPACRSNSTAKAIPNQPARCSLMSTSLALLCEAYVRISGGRAADRPGRSAAHTPIKSARNVLDLPPDPPPQSGRRDFDLHVSSPPDLAVNRGKHKRRAFYQGGCHDLCAPHAGAPSSGTHLAL